MTDHDFKKNAQYELIFNFKTGHPDEPEEGLYLVIDGMNFGMARYFKAGTIVSKKTSAYSPISDCKIAEKSGFYKDTKDGLLPVQFVIAYAKLPDDIEEVMKLSINRDTSDKTAQELRDIYAELLGE